MLFHEATFEVDSDTKTHRFLCLQIFVGFLLAFSVDYVLSLEHMFKSTGENPAETNNHSDQPDHKVTLEDVRHVLELGQLLGSVLTPEERASLGLVEESPEPSDEPGDSS